MLRTNNSWAGWTGLILVLAAAPALGQDPPQDPDQERGQWILFDAPPVEGGSAKDVHEAGLLRQDHAYVWVTATPEEARARALGEDHILHGGQAAQQSITGYRSPGGPSTGGGSPPAPGSPIPSPGKPVSPGGSSLPSGGTASRGQS